MTDLHEQMRAAEFASLAAFARAVLARAHAEAGAVRLAITAEVDGGEIDIQGELLAPSGVAVGGFGL